MGSPNHPMWNWPAPPDGLARWSDLRRPAPPVPGDFRSPWSASEGRVIPEGGEAPGIGQSRVIAQRAAMDGVTHRDLGDLSGAGAWDFRNRDDDRGHMARRGATVDTGAY